MVWILPVHAILVNTVLCRVFVVWNGGTDVVEWWWSKVVASTSFWTYTI